MPYIEISQEDIDFLTELSTELKTQDNCATGNPHFFTVLTKEKKGGYDEDITSDWGFIFDDDNYRLIHYNDYATMTEFVAERMAEAGEIDDEASIPPIQTAKEFEEYLEKQKIPYRTTGVMEVEEYQNVFLTSKACREYIESDRHNLPPDPKCYCEYARKNHELDSLIKIIKRNFAKEVNEDLNYLQRSLRKSIYCLLGRTREENIYNMVYDSLIKHIIKDIVDIGKITPEQKTFSYDIPEGKIIINIKEGKIHLTYSPKVECDVVELTLTLRKNVYNNIYEKRS